LNNFVKRIKTKYFKEKKLGASKPLMSGVFFGDDFIKNLGLEIEFLNNFFALGNYS
jgi:hypothetical protein